MISKHTRVVWPLLVFLLTISQGFSQTQQVAAASSAGSTDLKERFTHPPAEARIVKIIHNWPDAAAAQDQLIQRLQTQGFGGVVCNVNFQDYLESDAKWAAFVRAVKAAKQAGMALWLYDEKGYPSANAGGLVLRDHPDWEATGLLAADTECQGGEVTLSVPPGKLFLAAAFPVVKGEIQLDSKVDLTGNVADGKLSWQAPPGSWRVMAITESSLYEGTHAELNLAAKMPYPNLLLPEPTARFLEVTHQRYAQYLGNDLGQWFVATFTDEPSLMSLFLRRQPYRPLPWGPNLPDEFKRRRGYAIEPLVPTLLADAGAAGQKARYDFWRTVGELVSENYFGQIQRWCAQHDLRSGGHLLSEENILSHVPLYGDFFRCARRLDAPSIDCLTSLPSNVPWYIARLLSSAAELEGKTVVMCETSDHAQRYRPAGDKRPVRTVTEAEIRGTCNRLIVSGVNCITSYYSYAGLSDEAIRRLNEWIGRCCTMLTGGHQVAEVAVVYPIESIWPRFFPAHLWAQEAPEAMRIENAYRAVSDSLFTARRDFTYVDGRALMNAKPGGGRLVHGPLQWRVVVLPMADTLPLAAWENLATFVKQGGIVVAVGALPANSDSKFPSPRVQALARDVFGPNNDKPWVNANAAGGAGIYLPEGAVGLLPGLLNQLLASDVQITDKHAPLRVTHRRIDGHEVYFLINDRAETWEGEINVRASGDGEQWDPVTGTATILTGNRNLKLKLGGYEATLLRFTTAPVGTRVPLQTGALPNVISKDLPVGETAVAGGEFVEQQLLGEDAPGQLGRKLWRARGILTKSQVDTFLFVRFLFPQGLDLSDADMLAFDSTVPAGQRTSNQLLVILHEKNGADYLASSGRSLGAPGQSQTFVPLSKFQLAGWSKDANGRLDRKDVAEIRIGWGGYFGEKYERVEFEISNVQIVKEP